MMVMDEPKMAAGVAAHVSSLLFSARGGKNVEACLVDNKTAFAIHLFFFSRFTCEKTVRVQSRV